MLYRLIIGLLTGWMPLIVIGQVDTVVTEYTYLLEQPEASDYHYASFNVEGSQSYADLIKFDVTRLSAMPYTFNYFSRVSGKTLTSRAYLQRNIMCDAERGHLRVRDIATNEEVPIEQFLSELAVIDTIITFYPDTYEEEIKIIREDVEPRHLMSYTIRQQWLISEVDIRVNVLGIMPQYISVQGDDSISFYIENKVPDDPDDLMAAADIAWMKLTVDDVLISKLMKNSVNFRKLMFDSVRKKSDDVTILPFHYDPILSPDFEYGFDIIWRELDVYAGRVDTTTVFNPETKSREHPVFTKRPATYDDLTRMQLHQIWYYDKKNRALGCRLLRVGILQPVYDADGQIEYWETSFLRRNDEMRR